MIPGSANPLLLASAAAAGGYQVQRSLRFNSSDSAYLSRTPAVAGNRRTFTLSWWIKKSGLTTFQSLFNSFTDANNRTAINFDSSIGAGAPGDYLTMFNVTSATTTNIFQTNALFRDASAWYHIVVATDTTQATSTDRVKLWVNNTLQTFSTYNAPSQNADLNWNSATTHYYGVYGGSPSTTAYGFNGCLAECYLIDGQQLTPSSFTEVSATTGQLIPKTYTGTFGTNGFWLKFSDNSAATAAALGNDYSGNNNDWTPNNLSVTAGAGNDSLVDTPTSYGTPDTGVGGEVRGNYCTWNPVAAYLAGNITNSTLSNGNLDVAFINTSNAVNQHYSTIAVSSGKWYLEWTDTSANPQTNAQAFILGVQNLEYPRNTLDNTGGYGISNGAVRQLWLNTAYTNYWWSGTPAQNDIYGIALDCDNSTISFYRNNSSLGSSQSIPAGKTYAFAITVYQSYNGTPTGSANWGQRAFAYTAPSGFKALCDTNLPSPLIAKPSTVFDVVTYTGTGSSLTLPNGSSTPTSISFTPDFAWLKGRSGATNHALYDAVRGVQKDLVSNSTSAETTETTGLTAFGTNTFTVGSLAKLNTSSSTYVAWAWNAGGTTASNGSGSITSQVRANASAGFSVVSWTAGSAPVTIGHGLGVAPQFIIMKSRTSGAVGWQVGHASLGWTKRLFFDTAASDTTIAAWNDTAPTSTVFTVGSTGYQTGNMIAYCWTPVVGYSSFGSYTGNGLADGPFVYTGFRPRWVMIKRSSGGANGWHIADAARSPDNLVNEYLYADTSDSEFTNGSLDFLSNGFKLKADAQTTNNSGVTYVYACFAEAPFQYARAR